MDWPHFLFVLLSCTVLLSFRQVRLLALAILASPACALDVIMGLCLTYRSDSRLTMRMILSPTIIWRVYTGSADQCSEQEPSVHVTRQEMSKLEPSCVLNRYMHSRKVSSCFKPTVKPSNEGHVFAFQISFCRNSQSEQDTVIETVEEEIQMMSRLNHPHVVRILGATRQGCHFFMFVEWMPGTLVN